MEHFTLGIFDELSQYKKQRQALGYEMIDFSIGSPDSAPPLLVREEMAKSVMQEDLYGYSMRGTKEFNQAVSYFYKKHYQVDLDYEKEVFMLSGSQSGIVHLPIALVNPDETILVPDPGYTAYATAIAMAGAKIYPMPLKKENGFLPDLTKIPENVAQNAKLMILNYPGNPIPALATEDFFVEAIAFAKKYNIIIMHDFAYSELYFDNHKPISFLSVPGAKEVGIEFNSLSKTFNMAGCRIGYLTGNEDIISTFAMLNSNLEYGVFYPIQHAATAALMNSEPFCTNNRKIYQERRDTLVNGLKKIGWDVEKPQASMFLWAKVPDGFTSKEFTYLLIDKAGVVVTPGIAFGSQGEGYVRIALVQNTEKIKIAIKKIQESGIFECS